MLNEDRIILMTKLASYENGEGRKNVAIGNYFRSDYIGIQTAKSVLSAPVAVLQYRLLLNNERMAFY